MSTEIINVDLPGSSLVVDAVYGGSRRGNASDDPLPKLLGVDNSAGFRHLGKRPGVETLRLLVLKTSFSEPDWPDLLDKENGIFVYYGDNRTPRDLHDTPRQGNAMLRNLFDEAHHKNSSEHFPPIFLFSGTGTYRDVQFLGLAVPGAEGLGSDEDLVAVWRTGKNRKRFQNYRATFTVLDVPEISREWINDVQKGNAVTSDHAPLPWLRWVQERKYSPLVSTPSRTVRNKEEQLPDNKDLEAYVSLIHETYKNDPFGFEKCAMEIAKMFLPNIHRHEMTRPWRDGGRDAVGLYRIGKGAGVVDVEFALEAKCFAMNNPVGIKATSRLISRLRHRQFGILVTTSYVGAQAYSELVQDGHPVVIISAGDIALKLKEKFGDIKSINEWLKNINNEPVLIFV